MSRRRHKKEAAQRLAHTAKPPRPPLERPARPWVEIVLGPDGAVDRMVRPGVSRLTVLEALSGALVRQWTRSPEPEYDVFCFFLRLGLDLRAQQRLVADHFANWCLEGLEAGLRGEDDYVIGVPLRRGDGTLVTLPKRPGPFGDAPPPHEGSDLGARTGSVARVVQSDCCGIDDAEEIRP